MNCSCTHAEDSLADYVFCDKVVKARKNHKCSECNRAIQKNERYESFCGVWDGRVETHKTCSDCLSMRNSGLYCHGWTFGYVWGDFYELVINSSGRIDFDALSGLTTVALEKACRIITDYWDDL